LSEWFSAMVAGIALGGSLIIAIGAQNAFVLRQGIARDHVFVVVAVCVLCDWVLITLGAVGFGALVTAFPAVTALAAWGGAAFLAFYGAQSFRAALHPGSLAEKASSGPLRFASARAAIAATLAISLLNPHVYLDTVVLIGGIAAQYAGSLKWAFVVGAAVASLAWFAGLGFGARLLAPLFERPRTWRILDVVIGVIMWWIAAGLVVGQLR
jgi:L-lysine exporter family protein LysE/ArgO